MEGEGNARLVITATTKEIADTITKHVREAMPDCIVYATDVRANTRPPHINGVHQIVYLTVEAVDIE